MNDAGESDSIEPKPPKRDWRPAVAVILVVLTGSAVAWLGWQRWQARNPGEHRLQATWRAVRNDPRNATAWAALGDAQAAMDQLEAAEQSYRTAIALGGEASDPSVTARLGFQLYAQGDDAAALELLQKAEAGGAQVPMLSWTIDILRRQAAGSPPDGASGEAEPSKARPQQTSPAAEGQQGKQRQEKTSTPTPDAGDAPDSARGGPVERAATLADDAPCEVRLTRPHERAPYHVAVRVGDRKTALILDTGASITALSETLVRELELPIREDKPLNAITATGPAEMPTAVVDRVEVAGRVVEQKTVAVCHQCGGKHADGLFGLDLQAAMGMELDLTRNRVLFADCVSAPR